ncbi:fibronectin type III domain-containing protein [Deinococcus sedimenti]|uniref:Fibronectin type-III domain-containing protein n=1 Tax=Deinococcus sedimenti TaxID=1867090 RepID=A0ABQ2S2N6_9DEIO|nr:fibronectin type III domain-containing protein [Deinococcus sedimenti]GGR84558.1 hypothetical protein GCM10008960_09500 [Deinococcus sedimenti]
MPFILSSDPATTREIALQTGVFVSGTCGDFIDVSQMVLGYAEDGPMVLSQWITGSGAAPEVDAGGVISLVMNAGGFPVESLNWRQTREEGISSDLTLIGDARDAAPTQVTVTAEQFSGIYPIGRLMDEHSYSRTEQGVTTGLLGSDRGLAATSPLPELIVWERERQELTPAKQTELARQIQTLPPAHRPQARSLGRRIPVDSVVYAALATVPHRLLAPAPFHSFDFIEGDVTYSTLGKTARQIVSDIWGRVGYQTALEGDVLVIRQGGPSGDLILGDPLSMSYEKISLDAPVVNVQGGTRDPQEPDEPRELPVSPQPTVTPSATGAEVRWEAVKGASSYRVERSKGRATPYAGGWVTFAQTPATRAGDSGLTPDTDYQYRVTATVNGRALEPGAPTATRTTAQPSRRPNPIQNLQASDRRSNSVTLRWDPPENTDGKASATNYLIRVDGIGVAQTSQTWVHLDALTTGALITVAVLADSPAGTSDPVTATIQLDNLPPAIPSVSAELAGSPYSNRISISVPRPDGADTVQVRVRLQVNGLPGPAQGEQTFSVPTEPIEGAGGDEPITWEFIGQFSATYSVEARAENGNGVSDWSSGTTVTTDGEKPKATTDPVLLAFEREGGVLELSSSSLESSSRTRIWKSKGRVKKTEVMRWQNTVISGKLQNRKTSGFPLQPPREQHLVSTEVTQFTYGLGGYPDVITARESETTRYSTQFKREGSADPQVLGRDRTREEFTYSPQGHLERIVTVYSIGTSVLETRKADDRKAVEGVKMIMEEGRREESWVPAGRGLWLHTIDDVSTRLIPHYVVKSGSTTGDWDTMRTEPWVKEQLREVTETGPSTVSAPTADDLNPPDLERTSTESGRGLGDAGAWFKLSSNPSSTPATGADPKLRNDITDPDAAEQVDTGGAGMDGKPGEDLPTPATRDGYVVSHRTPGVRYSVNPDEISVKLPWVRQPEALRRYARMIGAGAGPRYRVTRVYGVPYNPPTLDLALETSIRATFDSFEMTVVTESRTRPD